MPHRPKNLTPPPAAPGALLLTPSRAREIVTGVNSRTPIPEPKWLELDSGEKIGLAVRYAHDGVHFGLRIKKPDGSDSISSGGSSSQSGSSSGSKDSGSKDSGDSGSGDNPPSYGHSSDSDPDSSSGSDGGSDDPPPPPPPPPPTGHVRSVTYYTASEVLNELIDDGFYTEEELVAKGWDPGMGLYVYEIENGNVTGMVEPVAEVDGEPWSPPQYESSDWLNSSGGSDGPGSSGGSDDDSDDSKNAIVPWRGSYLGWVCVESNRAEFEYRVEVTIPAGRQPEVIHVELDPRFAECVEPVSIYAQGWSCNVPLAFTPGLTTCRDRLVVTLPRQWLRRRPGGILAVTLRGARLDHAETWREFSREVYAQNRRFWAAAKQMR